MELRELLNAFDVVRSDDLLNRCPHLMDEAQHECFSRLPSKKLIKMYTHQYIQWDLSSLYIFLLLNTSNVNQCGHIGSIRKNPDALRKILHHTFVSRAGRNERTRYHSRKALVRRDKWLRDFGLRWNGQSSTSS